MSIYKVSIVIPAFNEEKNIQRVLESAYHQTYKNFEVIVVDDGSKDDTGKICKNYDQNYENFKYIYKENSGVSDARNLALKYVTGEYVCFWDADDWIESNYLRNLIHSLGTIPNPEETVLVTGCTVDYYVKKQKVKSVEVKIDGNLISNNELINSFVTEHEKYRLELWNKLFPMKVIKNRKFNSQFVLGEDFEFFTHCLKDIKYLLTINDVSYHYKVNIDEMKHYTSFAKEIEREKSIQKNLVNAGIESEDTKRFYYRRLLITAYTALSYLTNNSKNNIKEISFILNDLKKEKLKAFKPYANYKKAQYIMLILLQLHSSFFTKVYFKLKKLKDIN